MAIKEALAAGTITRDEAHTQLRDVDSRQRAAMTSSTELAAARAALKACRDTFNTSVRLLLTPEQQIIWDRFIESQKVGKDNGRGGDKNGRGNRK